MAYLRNNYKLIHTTMQIGSFDSTFNLELDHKLFSGPPGIKICYLTN